MAADAAMFSTMVERFAATKATAIRVFTHYAASVRRYLLVNTIFGAIVAFLDGVVLSLLGLPVPLLWAILAFITNYIPNIGFVIALIPPTLLAWLIGGWGPALVVVATYCVINFTMQQLVQPKFVSDAVRLSLTLTFFSVVFWAVVLGPVGALLAIPASLLVRALLLRSNPDACGLGGLPAIESKLNLSLSARPRPKPVPPTGRSAELTKRRGSLHVSPGLS